MADPPVRLLNFISEQQLEEVREKRGVRVEDGTIAADKPLFEILKSNKDKQQAEFNERFKHRPPKALDEEEADFLDKLEMYKKEQEKQLANEEAQQLLNFQAAVASRTIRAQETKTSLQQTQEVKHVQKEKRPAQTRPLTSLIRIKPQLKKAKIEENSVGSQDKHNNTDMPVAGIVSSSSLGGKEQSTKYEERTENTAKFKGLVSYGDESDED